MASSGAPNLHANFGLPVCLSGITHPLPLPLPEEYLLSTHGFDPSLLFLAWCHFNSTNLANSNRSFWFCRMADHDRRRKAMKTPAVIEPKDTSRRSSSAADDQERGNQTSPGDIADFASVLLDLASISLGRTAKAA